MVARDGNRTADAGLFRAAIYQAVWYTTHLIFRIELTRSAGEMAGESPPCRAAPRPLAVLLGCLAAACAPPTGPAFRSALSSGAVPDGASG